jgi:apolipoprotein N-acyltransferase
VQYQKHGTYTSRDYLPSGLEGSYLRLIRQVSEQGPRLLVLPETVSIGAVSLDGSCSLSNPDKPHGSRAEVDQAIRGALDDRPAVVVLGLERVEAGISHNALGCWTASGPQGWYDKRHLVPFGEYTPAWARLFGLRGESQFDGGRGAQIVHAGGLALGGFICQEVVSPRLFRETVLAGADLLVSGGNDGVFADPAVAAVHADTAQLRAVESGRYLVRAMKTGISAIIDPTGRELVRSPGARPSFVRAEVAPLEGLTLYARFGDWPVAAAGLTVAALAVLSRSAALVGARNKDSVTRFDASSLRAGLGSAELRSVSSRR